MKNINILNNLNSGKTSSYFTTNGTKEFTCENNGYVDNVLIEGQTLVNLVDYSTLNVEGSNCWTFRLKANTVYTLFNFLNDEDGHTCILNEDLTSLIGWTTDKAYTFLNPIDQKVVPHYNLPGFKIVILEGDHTDKPISYFEGLKSVGQGNNIEVLTFTNDKSNKIDLSNANWIDNKHLKYTNLEENINGYSYTSTYIPLSFKIGENLIIENGNPNVCFYDENQKYIPHNLPWYSSDVRISIAPIPTNAKYFRITVPINNKNLVNIYLGKYDKKQISTTLRSLPNGVKDTIEKRGNKYVKVQRCGEITLNGNESDDKIIEGVPTETTYRFGFYLSNLAENPPGVICVSDKFSSECNNNWMNDKEQVDQDKASVNIRILKTKLADGTKASIKSWLKSNPITIVYQLATPQIIELPNFNPQTYKGDNTLLINSGVIQCDASFDVCEGIRSELDVIKDKVSSLDNNVKNSLGSEISNEINTIKNTINNNTNEINTIKNTVNNNTNEINTIKNTVNTVQKTKMTEDNGACRGIPNNNANDIDITGFWMGSNVSNAPTGTYGWVYIESKVHNSLFQVQIATDLHNSERRWIRHKVDGGWSEWRSL